jgi:LmbE family N-acetylglucosaminyl deacetylase
MRILVVVAHPDDEVIGLGGTILKHSKNGDKVYLSIITEGVSAQYKENKIFLRLRRNSCQKSARFLGIQEVFFHDLPDAQLDKSSQLEINKIIEEDIKKVEPQRIYTHHWSDLHKDHRLVFESVLVASRRVKEVFCFETIGSTNKCKNTGNFSPNFYIDISKELDKKLKALSLYNTEIKKFPSPISLESIKILARFRGIESSLNAAEAFVCIKKIE